MSRKGDNRYSHTERGDARRASGAFRWKTRGTTLGQKFADVTEAKDGERRRGRTRGKRDSPKRPMGLCKRDIKISLQIAPATFPFRSRSAYRIETRETDCFSCRLASSRIVPSSLCSVGAHLDSTRERGKIFLQSLRFCDSANRFNCHEYCLCHCNDSRGPFADLY